jgi:hypothetical protein
MTTPESRAGILSMKVRREVGTERDPIRSLLADHPRMDDHRAPTRPPAGQRPPLLLMGCGAGLLIWGLIVALTK